MNKTIRITGQAEQTRRTKVIHARASLRSSKDGIDRAVEQYTANPSIETMWSVTDQLGKYNRMYGHLVEMSEYPCEIDLTMDLDYERDYYKRNDFNK